MVFQSAAQVLTFPDPLHLTMIGSVCAWQCCEKIKVSSLLPWRLMCNFTLSLLSVPWSIQHSCGSRIFISDQETIADISLPSTHSRAVVRFWVGMEIQRSMRVVLLWVLATLRERNFSCGSWVGVYTIWELTVYDVELLFIWVSCFWILIKKLGIKKQRNRKLKEEGDVCLRKS